ncbi:ROK family protein [Pelagovum sp. HNIBRBA483]|uniref:ROK family transcriptional regulator n=1 Tax=Pelagovum sp. HNIBRBA483 TaxID=3233341 RepID=UPI0034A0E684
MVNMNEGLADTTGGRSGLGSNQTGLRAHNERLILSQIRDLGSAAKADIARLTGLSAQTASVIMRELENDGLLERGEPVRGKVGQPSIPMRLSPNGALFFGLKVGRRSADLLLVNFLGDVLDRVHLPYAYPEPDSTMSFVLDAVRAISSRLDPALRGRVAGMGIAIPGYLWEWARIVGVPPENMAEWRTRDIRAELDALFDFPVYLQNDASCACGAEQVFGKRDYPSEFLYFYVGHFIGGGIVINRSLFTGPTGNAGAIGPMPIPTASGVQQLVDMASLSGLEAKIIAAGEDPSPLWVDATEWSVSSAHLDPWLAEAARGLALAIGASCAVIDFEVAVIDGWLPRDVLGDLVARVQKELAIVDWAGLVVPTLMEGTIGPDARSLGAASLPLSQRFLASASGL